MIRTLQADLRGDASCDRESTNKGLFLLPAMSFTILLFPADYRFISELTMCVGDDLLSTLDGSHVVFAGS